MTEEEINKKAEKHCNEVLCNAHENCNEVIKCRDWRSRRAGFFCGYEQALKDFEKENAELKADNDARKFAMAMSEKVEKQLRNERNTFLAQNEQYEKDLIDLNEQLTKAKEIIRSLYFVIQDRIDYKGNIPLEDEMYRARQFLKE